VTRAPQFTGTVRVSDGPALVMLAGELDLYSAPLLHDLLQQAVSTLAASVVVDMALVSFCDARGLGLLVAASNDLRESGRQLSVGPRPCRCAGSSRSPA
jgi:anti-sigma B factor antagonist